MSSPTLAGLLWLPLLVARSQLWQLMRRLQRLHLQKKVPPRLAYWTNSKSRGVTQSRLCARFLTRARVLTWSSAIPPHLHQTNLPRMPGAGAMRKLQSVAPNWWRLEDISCFAVVSHAVDLASFRDVSIRGIGRAGRGGQLIHTGAAGPDHPVHLQLAETSYLKALFFRLD